jgi:hypothetical protein
MSATGSQKRKIHKRYKERCAIIRAAFKPEEYIKHRTHQRRVLKALNDNAQQGEHQCSD